MCEFHRDRRDGHAKRDSLEGAEKMSVRISAALVLLAAAPIFASVVSYEADTSPVDAGWTLFQNYCNAAEWNSAGWLFQHVELCPGDPPPGGQVDAYTRSLADFLGAATFFLQWRGQTDAPNSEMDWGGGGAISVWSYGSVNYRFSIAADIAELNRDNTLPITRVPIAPGVPHTYRLELIGSASYTWFIDGQVIDTGIPEGPYPSFNPNMNFRAKAAFVGNTTKWDYIRYGTIPRPNSGDYDSDGLVTAADLYFFVDCLLAGNYDAAGPGCRWADMNGDGVANAADIQLFVRAMLGP